MSVRKATVKRKTNETSIDLALGRANQDRHLGPGHAVSQVRTAQDVRDQRRLLGRRIGDEDPHLSFGCARNREQGTMH